MEVGKEIMDKNYKEKIDAFFELKRNVPSIDIFEQIFKSVVGLGYTHDVRTENKVAKILLLAGVLAKRASNNE